MGTSQEFLNRLTAANLLPAATITKLQASPQLDQLDAKQVAEELIRRKLISVYQARVLLTKQTARFHYGPYGVVDRQTAGFGAGLFAAIHQPTRHPVNIDLVESSEAVEVERHCGVRHPHLIDCYEVVDEDGRSCVVLERVRGTSLVDVIQERALSTKIACRIVQQVASACWALHSAGLVHGLICPAAIVVVSTTQVRLLRRPGRHRQPETVGKLAEILNRLTNETTAPELSNDQRPSLEVDVYSLGRLLQLLQADSDDSVSRLIDSLVATPPERRLRHAGAVAAALAAAAGPVAESVDSTAVPEEADTSSDETFRVYAEYVKSQRVNQVELSIGDPTAMKIATDETSPSDLLRSRQRSTRRTQVMLGAGVGLALIVGGLLVAKSFLSSDTPLTNATLNSDPVETDPTAPAVLELDTVHLPENDPSLVPPDPLDDDGRSLWTSPTDGTAIKLRYVPTGTQLVLHARPSEILAISEGRRSLKALGPAFGTLRQAWEQEFGTSLENVEVLRAAVAPRDSKRPELCWSVDLVEGVDRPAKWSDGRQVTVDGQAVHVVGERAVWRSPENSLVFGNEFTVREVVEKRDSMAMLRRELEQLRAESDSDQLMTLLFAPNFIANEGQEIAAPQIRPIMKAVFDNLGDGARGCLVMLHLDGEQFFGELRLAGTDERGPAGKARQLHELARRLPLQMESAISQATVLDVYWRRLALRAARMMDFAVDHLRTGVEGRTVVANLTLPPRAAHNLLLAIELTTAANDSASAVGTTTAETSTQSLPIDQLLATKVSLEFPQQSLEFALRDLVDEVNSRLAGRTQVEIRIDGGSLRAEGITRNQQIRGFRQDHAPFAEVLTSLVMAANPVTTVRSPEEPEQDPIWVALSSHEPPGGAARIILITTRKAASENGYSLPTVFQAK